MEKLALVTGGAGFIGSHLCELLKCRIRILDNFSTGKKENLSNPDIEIIKGDIENPEDVDKAMQAVDVVYHLAAKVSVPDSVRDPIGTYRTNIKGTMNILESARKNKVNTIVFASSASVYGMVDFCDEKNQTNPTCMYAASKAAGEELCRAYSQSYGMNIACLRFFNVFGSRQDPGNPYSGVITKFIDCIKNNEPVTIFGDGTQTRDYIHAKDIGKAMILASEKQVSGTFNIATGKATSILELVDALEELYDKKIERNFQPKRDGDVLHSSASIEKAEKILGFHAEVRLKDGLREII